eukprot:CAMPEP_0172387278 /NCGR_PEP_ID=MMETSP1061-20121228/4593_1 /TAXON_ID=37318 /ORGANISM="Pseudo-nitzschia pungens, Strain cf. pungens" /LENGTH=420 /DNA_ID=CAMNT_0013116857 /DNA_START=139 /DNA_END=1401 /DNA_ORIENTATION=-
MKFLTLSSILGLATFASVSASEDRQLSALLTKWELNDPQVGYNNVTNAFTFNFDKVRMADVEQSASLYDYNCKDDGTNTFTEKPIVNGNGASFSLEADQTSLVTLDIDTAVLVKDPALYYSIDQTFLDSTYISKAFSTALGPADIGGGFMALCMRYGIGSQVDGAYKEVNFIETLIEIKYDLTAGITVAGFGVAPKEKVVTTQQKAAYNLIAYLCTTSDVTKAVGTGSRTYLVPTQSVPTANFNQGALITICIYPDDAAIDDGILMTAITQFEWKRMFGATEVKQPVLPEPNGNGLSLATPKLGESLVGGGTGYVYWEIESILFAEFYKSTGTVSGAGTATLGFTSARRRMLKGADDNDSEISEEALRRLQDGAEAEFDVAVDLTEGAEGPGALRTAGGASVGVTFLATVAAVVSAALLA